MMLWSAKNPKDDRNIMMKLLLHNRGKHYVAFVCIILLIIHNIAHKTSILYSIYPDDDTKRYYTLDNNDTSTGFISRSGLNATTVMLLPELHRTTRSRKLIYIHIGKTGGTSLDKVLRSNCAYYSPTHPFRARCESYHYYNSTTGRRETKKEIQLSKLTKKTSHLWRPNSKLIQEYIRSENITSLLFTIRNPISRVVSAFNMEHTSNTDMEHLRKSRWRENGMKLKHIFYNQCFPTVEDLAWTLVRKRNATFVNEDENTNITHDCYDLGLKAIQGKGSEMQGGHHLRYNYQFYKNQVQHPYPQMEVFVIRTETLWNDTDKLNHALGGNLGDITDEIRRHQFTFESEAKIVKSGLSIEGKRYICCHLLQENEVFETILKDAVNLSEKEKIEYAKGLYDDCGVSECDLDTTTNHKFIPFQWKEWKEGGGCDFM